MHKGWSVRVTKGKVIGHTLIDALEKVMKPPKRKNKKAFRMPVSGVYKIKGVGDVFTGRVEQDAIKPGANMPYTGNLRWTAGMLFNRKAARTARHCSTTHTV